MHPLKQRLGLTPSRREALLAMLGTASAALLPACGGGTDVAGLSSGGTGSFTTGTVVGLGSVIVNNIRYQNDAAAISLNGQTARPSALLLGMVVRIHGSAISPATTVGGLANATASSIDCSSEWKGVVSGVNPTSASFLLLGQTVRVLSNTVFAGASFNSLRDGQHAEVYGFVDPTDGSLRATRVEILDPAPSRYRLSGVVTNLTASTFQLGSATIEHAIAGLQNGQLVRVELQTNPINGHWVATEVKTEAFRSELQDGDEAEIEGSITEYTSATSFSVNGIPIDASRIIPPPTGLTLGLRVEVEGRISNGTVVASEVQVEDDDAIEAQEFEFHGTVSALDTTAMNFVVRGYTVRYTGSTNFELSGATWTDGLAVGVKARLLTSGDLVATKIESDD